MEDVEGFLDWLVALDIQHYKTETFPDYTPTGASHFYLKGSPERFTSKEMISIWTNRASKEVNERWQYAVTDVAQRKRHI